MQQSQCSSAFLSEGGSFSERGSGRQCSPADLLCPGGLSAPITRRSPGTLRADWWCRYKHLPFRIQLTCNKNENFTLLNFLFLDLVEREIKEVILDIKYPATKKQVSAHVNLPAGGRHVPLQRTLYRLIPLLTLQCTGVCPKAS